MDFGENKKRMTRMQQKKSADSTIAENDLRVQQIKIWAQELGFGQLGISAKALQQDEMYLLQWLQRGWHGDMHWMKQHGSKRSRPAELIAATVSVISVRMDYFPRSARSAESVLADKDSAYISRYALGADYHRLLRRRLQKLCDRMREVFGEFQHRCFSDSAPVLEKALARNGGLGWIGKHTNLIHPATGSWFFLGEIYTNLPLPVTAEFTTNHCGTCTHCIDVCPTKAIVAPYQLDARRCLSYLSIEFAGVIPVAYRKAMGNRIYGCDDCQLVCPWNKFSQYSTEAKFSARHSLDDISLVELFSWSRAEFEQKMTGSAIRRIGYERWQRNIAVALGNATRSDQVITALRERLPTASALLREHILWSLAEHQY